MRLSRGRALVSSTFVIALLLLVVPRLSIWKRGRPTRTQTTTVTEKRINRAPIRHLTDSQITPQLQRKRIDLLQKMNRRQLSRLERDAKVEGIIESFEIAFSVYSPGASPKLESDSFR